MTALSQTYRQCLERKEIGILPSSRATLQPIIKTRLRQHMVYGYIPALKQSLGADIINKFYLHSLANNNKAYLTQSK